jgi:hypothetical protein
MSKEQAQTQQKLKYGTQLQYIYIYNDYAEASEAEEKYQQRRNSLYW